jgi:hypothetical protein
VIIVSGLKAGATWEYSISGDNGFTRGTGSFTLANNTTYEVNTIQIRQTDETGNVSDISKNTLRRKFVGICPFYAISNTFIYGATIKVGCLSVINSSCSRGVDISINCRGLLLKYWICVIYDNTQSIFTYI